MQKILEVKENKQQFLPLLLIADEDEKMIMKYLDRSSLFVLDDDGVKGLVAVTDEGEGTLEIKNLAVLPTCQRKGYGRRLIDFVRESFAGEYDRLIVGTGDSPLTVPFYEKCGFVRFKTVANFFTDNYDHEIYECGILLRDMIYLSMPLK
ncbi:MAG: GNAT family N-acetyltransferase [Clostridia bacterium]|nr:GNAT family N-acetyltransferase [Clostridia bacterium]